MIFANNTEVGSQGLLLLPVVDDNASGCWHRKCQCAISSGFFNQVISSLPISTGGIDGMMSGQTELQNEKVACWNHWLGKQIACRMSSEMSNWQSLFWHVIRSRLTEIWIGADPEFLSVARDRERGRNNRILGEMRESHWGNRKSVAQSFDNRSGTTNMRALSVNGGEKCEVIAEKLDVAQAWDHAGTRIADGDVNDRRTLRGSSVREDSELDIQGLFIR
jgi:hypothetical protein